MDYVIVLISGIFIYSFWNNILIMMIRRDQIIYFIENVIKEPVHLAGNSLGGYLSIIIGSYRPDLVKSIVLMNATPFWGFQSMKKGQSNGWIWNGVLPAPKWFCYHYY